MSAEKILELPVRTLKRSPRAPSDQEELTPPYAPKERLSPLDLFTGEHDTINKKISSGIETIDVGRAPHHFQGTLEMASLREKRRNPL